MWYEAVAVVMNYLTVIWRSQQHGMLLSEKRQPRFCVLNIEEHAFQG